MSFILHIYIFLYLNKIQSLPFGNFHFNPRVDRPINGLMQMGGLAAILRPFLSLTIFKSRRGDVVRWLEWLGYLSSAFCFILIHFLRNVHLPLVYPRHTVTAYIVFVTLSDRSFVRSFRHAVRQHFYCSSGASCSKHY